MKGSRAPLGALGAPAFALGAALAVAACSPSPHDVVPSTRDVRASSDAAAPRGGYVHVAKRPHAAVALAGSHALSREEASAIIDRVADELESCARTLDAQGALDVGAARVVAVAGPGGAIRVAELRLGTGERVAANALLCLVAPLRAMTLPPPGDGGAPAVAIDATWSPSLRPQTAPPLDAGVEGRKPL